MSYETELERSRRRLDGGAEEVGAFDGRPRLCRSRRRSA
jgi:hypothetical protein